MAKDMPTTAERFRIGDWMVVPAEGRLQRTGQRRRVEPRTMGVLCALAAGGGAICSADALLSACWPGQALGDNTIHKHVALLRAALDDNVHRPRYIGTVHRRGYRLLEPAVAITHGVDVAADAEALLTGACALSDVLDDRPPTPGICMVDDMDAHTLSRLMRDNRRLRALCAALLQRCREATHGGAPRVLD